MSDNRVDVRSIAWRELFPWLLIFRAPRVALSLPVIFLASLGALLTPVGWHLADDLFGRPIAAPPAILALPALDFPLLDWRQLSDPHLPEILRQGLRTSVLGVSWVFIQPLAQLLDGNLTSGQLARASFVGLWNILVWALFAGAITRIAVVQLGREERVGLQDALRYSFRHLGWNVAAPLFPLAGILFCCVPIALLGLLMRLDIGVLAAGLIWFLVLLGGAAMATLLLGLAFGWPLMWPAISAEETGDAFEAFSRSYSFTMNRPLNYFFYAVLTVFYGLICWLIVWAFATGVVQMAYWAASWGAGNTRIAEIVAPPQNHSFALGAGAALIHLGVLIVRVVATGFNHAFFWCAASAIYLCLRRDVDRTETDEVFVDGEETRYQLPSLAHGANSNGESVASSSSGIGAESPVDPTGDNRADVS